MKGNVPIDLRLFYGTLKPLQTRVYLFIYLFIISLMLIITEQMLFTIKISNKMLIDVNTVVKNPIEYKTFY